MAFDPSIISQIPDYAPDIAGAQQRGVTLADMYDKAQMNKLALTRAKEDESDRAKAKEIFKTASYDTPEGVTATAEKLTRAGLQDQAMGFMQTANQYQSGQMQRQKQQIELAATQQDAIAGTLDNVYGQLEQYRQTPGVTPVMLDAKAQQLLMPAIQGLAQSNPELKPTLAKFAQNPQNFTYQGIKSAEASSNKGQEMLKARLAELNAETSRKKEEETERKDTALIAQGNEKVHQGQEKIDIQRTKDGGLTDQSTDSIAEQYMAGDTSAITGLKPADRVKIRNRIADIQEIRGLTGADQAAANAQFAGIKAGERALGTRQANIDTAVKEAQNIEPILRQASAKVDRAKFTTWNKLFQIAEEGSSDADLLAFAQAAKSFANIYTRATVPGAGGVDDRREAVKHLPIFTDQKSFDAVLDIMDSEMKAAQKSPGQVRDDLKDDITGHPKKSPPEPKPGSPSDGKVVKWDDLQ